MISKLRILVIVICELWETAPPKVILKDVELSGAQLTFNIPTELQDGDDEYAIEDGMVRIRY